MDWYRNTPALRPASGSSSWVGAGRPESAAHLVDFERHRVGLAAQPSVLRARLGQSSPVPVQIGKRRGGRVGGAGKGGGAVHIGNSDPGTGADVAEGSPVPPGVSGGDVGGASPAPAQLLQGRARFRRRCGRGEPSPGADVAGVSPVPAQMWERRKHDGTPSASWRGRAPCDSDVAVLTVELGCGSVCCYTQRGC